MDTMSCLFPIGFLTVIVMEILISMMVSVTRTCRLMLVVFMFINTTFIFVVKIMVTATVVFGVTTAVIPPRVHIVGPACSLVLATVLASHS